MNITDVHFAMNRIIIDMTFESNLLKRNELYQQYRKLSLMLCRKRVGAEQTIQKLKEDLKCQNK